jgi:hypothetical protein
MSDAWVRGLLYVAGIPVTIQGPILVVDEGIYAFVKGPSGYLELLEVKGPKGFSTIFSYNTETVFTLIDLKKTRFRWEAPIVRREGRATVVWELTAGGGHRLLGRQESVERIFQPTQRQYNPYGYTVETFLLKY